MQKLKKQNSPSLNHLLRWTIYYYFIATISLSTLQERLKKVKKVLRTIISNKAELNNSQQINDVLYNFYQTLFKEKLSLSEECIQDFLDKVSLSKFTENQTLKCAGPITGSELLNALTSMNNDKSPRNEDITKEFYIKFWEVIKEPFFASIQQSFIVGQLSTSQK